jgi:hypothetical protein
MTITYRPLRRSYLDNAELLEMLKKEESYIKDPYDYERHVATIRIGSNISSRE